MNDAATLTVEPEPAPEPEAAPPAGTRRGRAPLNPVLARELRIRLRGGRTWILLTGYLLVLCVICYVVYEAESGSGATFDNRFFEGGFGGGASDPTQFASVGRAIFEWLVFFMLLLVLFLVPGLTAGAIAGERERQTLVPLQVTMLRPWQIVVGKLGASFAFLALLVVATAPLLAIAYLIGGVTVGSVLRGLGVVLFTGIVLTGMCLLASAVFRRVQAATVASYALVLLLTLGSALVFGAAAVIDRSRGSDGANPPAAILAANPLFTAADLLDDDGLLEGGGGVSSPFGPMQEALDEARFGDRAGFSGPIPVEPGIGGFAVDDGGRRIVGFDDFGRPIIDDGSAWPFWATSVITLYVLGVAGTLVAVSRLRSPSKAER